MGRRFERSAVRELLSQSRLVTLTGFGGIGKTRLAIRIASELRRVFPDGVCFVPLGDLREAEGVPDQIAGALGLFGRSTQSSTVAVVEYLTERSLLLVLAQLPEGPHPGHEPGAATRRRRGRPRGCSVDLPVSR